MSIGDIVRHIYSVIEKYRARCGKDYDYCTTMCSENIDFKERSICVDICGYYLNECISTYKNIKNLLSILKQLFMGEEEEIGQY